MTKTDKLKLLIADSGLKKTYISERLGLSRAGYQKKENGEREFTASEVGEMRKLLSLTDAQVKDIFLS